MKLSFLLNYNLKENLNNKKLRPFKAFMSSSEEILTLKNLISLQRNIESRKLIIDITGSEWQNSNFFLIFLIYFCMQL